VYFEIYREGSTTGDDIQSDIADREWRWRLKGGNHEIIASGEGYGSHADCLRAVYLVRKTSNNTPIRDV
jgi:uncharacterized protein YegP (UPF0339 family)